MVMCFRNGICIVFKSYFDLIDVYSSVCGVEGTAHAWYVGCWVSDIIIRGDVTCDRCINIARHMAVILAMIRGEDIY